MSIGAKLLIIFGVALGLIFPTVAQVVDAVEVPSTVQIEALTCGMIFTPVSPLTIDYGSLMPNEISSEKFIEVQNSGNSAADHFYISGTDWTYNDPDIGDITVMLVDVTHYQYNNPNVDYDTKNALSSTPYDLGTPSAGSTFAFYFQVKAVLQTGYSGALGQQVTLATEC